MLRLRRVVWAVCAIFAVDGCYLPYTDNSWKPTGEFRGEGTTHRETVVGARHTLSLRDDGARLVARSVEVPRCRPSLYGRHLHEKQTADVHLVGGLWLILPIVAGALGLLGFGIAALATGPQHAYVGGPAIPASVSDSGRDDLGVAALLSAAMGITSLIVYWKLPYSKGGARWWPVENDPEYVFLSSDVVDCSSPLQPGKGQPVRMTASFANTTETIYWDRNTDDAGEAVAPRATISGVADYCGAATVVATDRSGEKLGDTERINVPPDGTRAALGDPVARAIADRCAGATQQACIQREQGRFVNGCEIDCAKQKGADRCNTEKTDCENLATADQKQYCGSFFRDCLGTAGVSIADVQSCTNRCATDKAAQSCH